MSDEIRMKDLQWTADDKKRLTDEFGPGWGEWNQEEFREASRRRMDELLDTYNLLGESAKQKVNNELEERREP